VDQKRWRGGLFAVGLVWVFGWLLFFHEQPVQAQADEMATWTKASHSDDVDPDYDVVFPQTQVNAITITVTSEIYAAMQANMTKLYGEPRQGDFPGSNRQPPTGNQPISPLAPPGRGGQGISPPRGGQNGFEPPSAGGGFRGGPGLGIGYTREKPMWVTATLEFDGKIWPNVGLRYKGNSSLRSGWDSGTGKLPFKLDFDEFEDAYPAIKNQRFYGFKQLSLANNFSDATFMRDAITYDLLDEAGLVAAETAPYEIYFDHGDGVELLGLYTMIEVIDDTVIKRYFSDDKGNLYEGDGPAASLAEGSFDEIEESFQKENNDNRGWDDLEQLYEVLHSETRTEDPAAWREELEDRFDVETFLKWLALSALVQHWDTYGALPHNFYLYHDPETEQLTWISWDHNLVLSAMGGFGGRMRNRSEVSFDKANVSEEWPLIRFLLDDPIYHADYLAALEEVADAFDPDDWADKYAARAEILAPHAEAEIGKAAFTQAVQALTDQTYKQAEAVATFLKTVEP